MNIQKITAGVSVGSGLYSAGCFEWAPTSADLLISHASQTCDIETSVETLIRAPNTLSAAVLHVNVVAVDAHSVSGGGTMNIHLWRHRLWSGFQPRYLPAEAPLRLAIAGLRLTHSGAIWYATELGNLLFVSQPPGTGGAPNRRRLLVRAGFEPKDSDIVLFGVW